jgi:hypothetical protein
MPRKRRGIYLKLTSSFHAVHEDITEIDKKVDVIRHDMYIAQQQQERDKILEWLDPTNFHTKKFGDCVSVWKRGTGEQFLESEEFLSWANKKNTHTLWCPGIPGAGKTIFASVVINHLNDAQKHRRAADRAGIAFLYCEYKNREAQTLPSLLVAVLRQLAEQHTLSIPSIKELYRSHLINKAQPNVDEILSALSDAVRHFCQVFLIVDALDECSGPRELVSKLQELQKKSEMKLKLLITSRPTVEFPQCFEECSMLEIRASERDVKAVLDDEIKKKLSKCVITDSELWKMVKEDIAAAVDGMSVTNPCASCCFIAD